MKKVAGGSLCNRAIKMEKQKNKKNKKTKKKNKIKTKTKNKQEKRQCPSKKYIHYKTVLSVP